MIYKLNYLMMSKKLNNLAPILFVLVVSLTPLIWFLSNHGSIIDGLDTNFPINPIIWFTRRMFIWNSILNGGSNFGSSVSGLFFHLLQAIPFSLGFSIRNTELFTLLFWSLAVAISAYVFVSEFVSKNKLVQSLFIVLYYFNIYMFNTWENVKVSNLALVIGLPLILVLLKLRIESKLPLFKISILTILVSIIISGSGINPAYFLCILLGSIIYLFVSILCDLKKAKEIVAKSFIIYLIFFLTNLFWIIPLIVFLFVNSHISSLSSIGFTDWLGSLSEHTSIVNVLRLQGAWDWYTVDGAGMPLYIPYALKYFTNFFFIAFSFVIPTLAILSLAIRKKDEKLQHYIFPGLLVLLGVFLGVGSHKPTGVIFEFLSKHLPFFSFFRSPWYIFTPLTILGLASLSCLLLDNLIGRSNDEFTIKRIKVRTIVFGFVAMLIASQIIYSYPQLTGKIYRPGRSDSFYVNFPTYVTDSEKWLATSGFQRILTYPDDQLESFNWGYKGTESILSLFSDKEVVSPTFNSANPTYSNLLDKLYLHLKRNEYESAFSEARFFSVDSLFAKRDVDTLASQITDSANTYLPKKDTFGYWDFYNIDQKYVLPKVYTANNIYEASDVQNIFPSVAKALSSKDIVLDSKDTALKALKSFEIKKIIKADKDTTSLDQNKYTFSLESDSNYKIVFDNYSDGSLSVLLDDRSIDFKKIIKHDSYIEIPNLSIKKGVHTIETINNQKIDLLDNSLLTKYKSEISIKSDSKKVNITPEAFDPKAKYELSFEYKHSYGSLPSVNIRQWNGTTQYRDAGISLYTVPQWTLVTEEINPVLVNSNLTIEIKPNVEAKTPFLTEFRNLSIKKINNTEIYLIESGKDDSNHDLLFSKKDPTNYSAQIATDESKYILVFNYSYDPGWKISSDDYIGSNPIHFRVNGFANAWYIPTSHNGQIFNFNYEPQKYYQLALLGVPLTLAILLVSIYILRKRG